MPADGIGRRAHKGKSADAQQRNSSGKPCRPPTRRRARGCHLLYGRNSVSARHDGARGEERATSLLAIPPGPIQGLGPSHAPGRAKRGLCCFPHGTHATRIATAIVQYSFTHKSLRKPGVRGTTLTLECTRLTVGMGSMDQEQRRGWWRSPLGGTMYLRGPPTLP